MSRRGVILGLVLAIAGAARGEEVVLRYFRGGDPYHCQCHKTARLLAEALDLSGDQCTVAFQSRLGKAEWLKPYADETIEALGRGKLERLDVLCPGFAADCLETLEETAMQNRDIFREAGGGDLHYIPALNARDDHVAFLARLVQSHFLFLVY